MTGMTSCDKRRGTNSTVMNEKAAMDQLGGSEASTRPQLMSRMAINDNKAGMEGLDKDKINQIIYEASKGSKFYENERKKEQHLDLKILEQKAIADSITPSKLLAGIKEADRLLDELEQGRDLSRTIVHLDMDAFYAAVEMRDDPSLRNKPMAVGGMGMLSTSNYLARKFGVRAAMPGFIGLKLCPDLVMVQPNFDKYTAVSRDVRQVMSYYDPNFCPMSLDEAYLDFTSHLEMRITSSPSSRTFLIREKKDAPSTREAELQECTCDLNQVLRPLIINEEKVEFNHPTLKDDACLSSISVTDCPECRKQLPQFSWKLYGTGLEEAVLEMRNRIEQRTYLTASAGIAPNMMLAKVCSDRNKPNGQFRILPSKEAVEKFVAELPIRKISGIGKVTEKLLGAVGVTTCQDLYEHRALLYHLFSSISFHHFMSISLGIGSTCVERDGERKSVSTEHTFSEMSEPKDLYSKCEELCNSLAMDLQEDQIKGKTVTLKIKTVNFEVKTRSQSLQLSTDDKATIFTCAKHLLKTEIDALSPAPLRLRLMGVRMSRLEAQAPGQTTVRALFKKELAKKTPASQSEVKADQDEENTSEHFPGFQTLDSYSYDEYQSHTNGNASPHYFGKYSEVDERYSEDEDFSAPVSDVSPYDYGVSKMSEVMVNEHHTSDTASSKSPNQSKGKLKSKAGKGKETILKFVKKESENSVHGEHQEKGENMNSFTSVTEVDREVQSKSVAAVSEDSKAYLLNDMQQSDFLSHITVKDTEYRPSTTTTNENLHEKDTYNLNTDSNNLVKNHTQWEDCVQSESLMDSAVCEAKPGAFLCPVCGMRQATASLEVFNSHVDSCLNRETIKNILHDQEMETSVAVKAGKRRRNMLMASDGKQEAKRTKSQPSVLAYFK